VEVAFRRGRSVTFDRIGATDGDMRPLIDRRFKCTGCGSMFAGMWLFVMPDEADAWAANAALVSR
jgi:hypothetical protein